MMVRMSSPVVPPVKPMLAKRAGALPKGDTWIYEPKWDGFRAIVFRDGDEVYIQSRDLKQMNRYFPELEAPLLRNLPPRCVVDGEIVIATGGNLDFDALLLRIHPAASRVAKLAEETPASFVAFDLLCLGEQDLSQRPFRDRRRLLEDALHAARPPIHLTPATRDRGVATDWFERFEGAGLDGVIAKADDARYEPGKRTMLKVKHQRTAACVVAGFRWHKDGEGELVGSLLLGLYDADGTLHHAGVAASFAAAKRRALTVELAPYRQDPMADHPWASWAQTDETGQRMPGASSRWNRGKDLSWVPLRPQLVVEVSYDHMQGDRFRHTAHFVRWRPDKPAAECTYAQLEVTPPYELQQIFRA